VKYNSCATARALSFKLPVCIKPANGLPIARGSATLGPRLSSSPSWKSRYEGKIPCPKETPQAVAMKRQTRRGQRKSPPRENKSAPGRPTLGRTAGEPRDCLQEMIDPTDWVATGRPEKKRCVPIGKPSCPRVWQQEKSSSATGFTWVPPGASSSTSRREPPPSSAQEPPGLPPLPRVRT
jgi:hypothetical protein